MATTIESRVSLGQGVMVVMMALRVHRGGVPVHGATVEWVIPEWLGMYGPANLDRFTVTATDELGFTAQEIWYYPNYVDLREIVVTVSASVDATEGLELEWAFPGLIESPSPVQQ